METKTAKILTILEDQKRYTGQNGMVYVHLITFENDSYGRPWEYHCKKQNCEKFKIGEVATFDTEIKQNGQYTNYKIKPIQADGSATTFKAADPKNQGRMVFLSCLSSAATFFSTNKPSDWQDVLAAAELAYDKAIQKSL